MIDHLARPGPGYWEWKCLRCDGLVADHPGWLRLLWHRMRHSRG